MMHQYQVFGSQYVGVALSHGAGPSHDAGAGPSHGAGAGHSQKNFQDDEEEEYDVQDDMFWDKVEEDINKEEAKKARGGQMINLVFSILASKISLDCLVCNM